MGTIWKVLTRKKVFDNEAVQDTKFKRVLSTFDLTALGVGSTLGVGVYVIVGHVARDTAGPSVVLSFLIAAIASVFAGLCYAEFGARTPRAGSAYIYSYTCIGEFVAFVIGWNLILEYVIGSASVAKGLSVYIDTLANDTLKNAFMDIAPINVQYMAEYFDFFSCGIAILLAVALAFGMKKSSIMNNIFTAVNIMVVLFVIVAGSMNADPNNWRVEPNNDAAIGEGGFFPFGISGMIKGAATCFYAFIGFDTIATTGEEVKNPRQAIPIAIVISLLICFLCYFSTATVVTMMVPFYAQDINAPLPHAFAEVGWIWAKWIVAIGGIFGLFASLFGAMFPLPRILYAMASDGLIFRFLGIVNDRFASPVIGTLLAGVLTGLMSALFDLAQLVNMMSIGTLLAYTIVAACVLLLRFEADEEVEYSLLTVIESESDFEYTDSPRFNSDDEDIKTTEADNKSSKANHSGVLKNMFGYNQKRPSKSTEKLAAIYVIIYSLLALILGLFFFYIFDDLVAGEIYAIVLTSVVVFFMIAILMLLALQPTTTRKLSFKVPLVPFIPALSILINVYLMLMLDAQTWIRFGVWMIIGVPMYIFLRLCCRAKQSTMASKNVLNGEVSSNGHIIPSSNSNISNGDVDNGYKTDQPSAPPEDYSEDSGFESNIAVSTDVSSPDEIPSETTPRKSLSNSVDIVMSVLDNVIKHEETIQTASAQSPERKHSVDTVSNASCLPIEEKVVALVHRENEISEPTTPSSNPSMPPMVLATEKADEKKDNTFENDVQNLEFPSETPNETPNIKEENKSEGNIGVDVPPLIATDEVFLDKEIDNNIQKPSISNDESSTEYALQDADQNTQLTIKYSGSSSDESQPVSLEDLHSERNESDTDIIEEVKPVIPIAPPMENFESFKPARIPRITLEKKDDSTPEQNVVLRLKPIRTQHSQIFDTDLNSRDSGIDEPSDGNMAFGTDQHKAFKSKLEQMLRNNNTVQKRLTKPEQHEIDLPRQSDTLKHKMSQLLGEIVKSADQAIPQETDSEKVDDEFKGKLANILAGKSLRSVKTRQNIDNKSNDKSHGNEASQNNLKRLNSNDQETHKDKMSDTFSRIKLRKVDSFKEQQ
ncbi:hypothetical protein Trydic_g11016 [Trypoxylus dichotomus]